MNGVRIDPKEADLARILMIGALANNADIEMNDESLHIIGDPTEGALLVAAKKAGILDIRDSYTRLEEFPFDSDRKRMATVNETVGGGRIISMKGAPEVVLGRCMSLVSPNGIKPMTDIDRKLILARADGMADRALRVLALAWKPVFGSDPYDVNLVESDLIFAGLTGMMGPSKVEALEAIRLSKMAGIRTVMITGDHRLTARAISEGARHRQRRCDRGGTAR